MMDSECSPETWPVRFTYEGVEHSVEVDRFQAAAFEAAVAPFIAAARRAPEAPGVPSP